MARFRRWHRGRQGGQSRHHGPQYPLLPRLFPNEGSHSRTARHRRLPAHARGLPAGSLREAQRHGARLYSGRTGQPLDGVHRDGHPFETHAAAATGRRCRGRMGLRPQGFRGFHAPHVDTAQML